MLRRLLSILLLGATCADAVVTEDCALPGSDCVIADVARQAHVFVGAVTNERQGAAERALLAGHFNATTPENEMKWGVIARTVGHYDFASADAIADFAERHGLRLRGHPLVWGRLQLPLDLVTTVEAAADPAARLRELMREHFETMIARYGDRVDVWDVVNEPLDVVSDIYDQNLFWQTLGPGYVADAFMLARALDPDAELFLNEFFLFLPSAKADAFVNLVRDLRAAGVPIDGVGVQGHVFPSLPLPEPAALEALLRSLGDLGVTVELTEVDVSLWHFRTDPDPLARQAEYYGAIVAACMTVPACRGVTTWGLLDSATWLDFFPPFDAFRPNAPLLFDAQLAPKPAYFAVRDAVARRAVPFFTQATSLREAYDAGVGGGTVRGRRLRLGGRALRRAERFLEGGQFARACRRLRRVANVLAAATGTAARDLEGIARTLEADLRCDEP